MKREQWFYLSGGHITTDVGPHWPAHVVCDVNTDHPDHDARARLISAAPEMFDLADDVLSEQTNLRREFRNECLTASAYAVIKRARGWTDEQTCKHYGLDEVPR